ncbi:MAG: CDP-alcohol phosphatidyltransferase family protein [Eubacterium sp.]|nr:CDP-alcohol phosphatidyltransferase family protein [Eubacterium sp.]
MKKNLANIVSSSRILCAVWLLFFSEITALFMAVYSYCGFSDLVDGRIARKFDTISLLGAKLDTAGDVLTYVALVKILCTESVVPFWALIWYAVALVGFVVSAVISKVRLGKFYFVHSLFGKVLGVAIFVIPFAIKLMQANIYFGIVCVVASVAAIESIIIQSKSKEIKTDVIYVKD